MFKYFYFSVWSIVCLITAIGSTFFTDNLYGALGAFFFLDLNQCTMITEDIKSIRQKYKWEHKEMPEELKRKLNTKAYLFFGTTLSIFFGTIFYYIFSNL